MELLLKNNFGKTPTFIYKFCRFENDYYLDILTKKQLYFSPPDKFIEDQDDCYIEYDFYSGNKNQKYQFHFEATKFLIPELSDDMIKKLVVENMRKPEFNSQQLKQKYDFYFRNNIGVCCFSKSLYNKLLWENYASSFTGFCIEFNYEELEKNITNLWDKYQFAIQPIEVQYYEKKPKIKGFIDTLDQKVLKQVGAKRIKYKEEEEIRFVYFDGTNEKFLLSDSCISKIFIGGKTTDINKTRLINSISKHWPDTKVFEMKKNDDTISFIETNMEIEF